MHIGNAQSANISGDDSAVAEPRGSRFHRRLQRLIAELASESGGSLRPVARRLGLDESIVSRVNDPSNTPRDTRASTIETMVDQFRIRADYFFDRAEPSSYRAYMEGTAPSAPAALPEASHRTAGDSLVLDLLESGKAGAAEPAEIRELRRIASLITPAHDPAQGLELLETFMQGRRAKLSTTRDDARQPSRRR